MSDVMKHDETELVELSDASVDEVGGGAIIIGTSVPFMRWVIRRISNR